MRRRGAGLLRQEPDGVPRRDHVRGRDRGGGRAPRVRPPCRRSTARTRPGRRSTGGRSTGRAPRRSARRSPARRRSRATAARTTRGTRARRGPRCTACMDERRAGIGTARWRIVGPSFYPDDAALAAAERDVLQPWVKGSTQDAQEDVRAEDASVWWIPLATPLDGDLKLSATLPRDGQHEVALVAGNRRTVLKRAQWVGQRVKRIDDDRSAGSARTSCASRRRARSAASRSRSRPRDVARAARRASGSRLLLGRRRAGRATRSARRTRSPGARRCRGCPRPPRRPGAARRPGTTSSRTSLAGYPIHWLYVVPSDGPGALSDVSRT